MIRILANGAAFAWDITPRCTSCAAYGIDPRCHCHGTGFYLHCRVCDQEVRSNEKGCASIDAGEFLFFQVCSKQCEHDAEAECIEMQRPARRVA